VADSPVQKKGKDDNLVEGDRLGGGSGSATILPLRSPTRRSKVRPLQCGLFFVVGGFVGGWGGVFGIGFYGDFDMGAGF
jgi:hypothetical protein